MPLKIVRNDICKMNTEAIVNTAHDHPAVGTGCDYAIYTAAGYDKLLQYRREKIGYVPEGEVFLTPAFDLPCKYIIHAVSPLYVDGKSGEEEKLRACYRKSLELALENDIRTIAFPLIGTGGFGYPKEEGFRIAADEINAFLTRHDMTVYLVVFGRKSTMIGNRLLDNLESYIDAKYVEDRHDEEYTDNKKQVVSSLMEGMLQDGLSREEAKREIQKLYALGNARRSRIEENALISEPAALLDEKISHASDTFSQYLLYLIASKGMSYPSVYQRACIDKKVFSRLKNDPNSHPKKITAMCLCIGAMLTLEQSRDLLARAGYALSPCDKQDIIFSYFIENGIYDMIDLDIALENHGLDCLID